MKRKEVGSGRARTARGSSAAYACLLGSGRGGLGSLSEGKAGKGGHCRLHPAQKEGL